MTNIGMIVGSLRKESISKKIAAHLATLFPEGFKAEFIEIGSLPHYNEDIDDGNNAAYEEFRSKMRGIDAVLFVTPEYNRTVPGVLKNAIDVGSRPYGASIWDGKPAAIISQSQGALGGFGANHHLRQALVFLNMPVVQQPEAYIGNSASLLDDNGKMKDESTIQFLQSFVDTFVALIQKCKA